MPTVTYAGSRDELRGQKFDVPDAVMKNARGNSVAQFIEQQVDDATEVERAQAEATTRRQQALAERIDAERREVEAVAEANRQTEGQATRDEEFKVELSDLSQAVMTSGAAIVGKAEAIEAKQQEWERRHEVLIECSEAVSDAADQVTFCKAVTAEGDEQLKAHIAQQEERIGSLNQSYELLFKALWDPAVSVVSEASQVVVLASLMLIRALLIKGHWVSGSLVAGWCWRHPFAADA